jgi:2-polyprenyl-6-methoxyphenol hydroxylase-like FAD-dependent oxidoreductase
MTQTLRERSQDIISWTGWQGSTPAPAGREHGEARRGVQAGAGRHPGAGLVAAGPLDVIVVGGGLAGAALAVVLAWAGRRVQLLLDTEADHEPVQAVKLEASQIAGLRRLGLLDVVKPAAAPIREIWDAKDGRLLRKLHAEQLGLPAGELVRRIRDALPARSMVRPARVQRIVADPARPRVLLDGGEELSARVIVMASGAAPALDALGVERRPIEGAPFSLASDFDIAPARARAFPFQSLTYYPEGTATRVAYLSLFQVPGAMRAHLFSYHDPEHPWAHALAREPERALAHALPRLSRVIGPFRVAGAPRTRPVALYRSALPALPGVVLIGDAFQSTCPATGTALSALLTDVKLLATRYLPRWLATPALDAPAIQSFYDDAEKAAIDHESVTRALYRKQVSLDDSIRFRLHRQRSYAGLWASGRWERLNTLVARVRR